VDRRRFLLTSLAGVIAAPLAEAQQAGKVWRIGYLGYGVPGSDPSGIEGLRQGLRELGYVENQSVVVEYRYAEGRPDRLASLISELIDLKVDILLAQGSAVTAAAKHKATTTPVVTVSADPVGSGFVQSLARPGGNITGLSFALGENFSGKWLQLVRETVPKASHVGIIWNPASRFGTANLASRRLRPWPLGSASGCRHTPCGAPKISMLLLLPWRERTSEHSSSRPIHWWSAKQLRS
jgi:ABC transporter substrate binding protein